LQETLHLYAAVHLGIDDVASGVEQHRYFLYNIGEDFVLAFLLALYRTLGGFAADLIFAEYLLEGI